MRHGLICGGKAALQHGLDAGTHHEARVVVVDRGKAFPPQDHIQRFDEVRRGLNQRAV